MKVLDKLKTILALRLSKLMTQLKNSEQILQKNSMSKKDKKFGINYKGFANIMI